MHTDIRDPPGRRLPDLGGERYTIRAVRHPETRERPAPGADGEAPGIGVARGIEDWEAADRADHGHPPIAPATAEAISAGMALAIICAIDVSLPFQI